MRSLFVAVFALTTATAAAAQEPAIAQAPVPQEVAVPAAQSAAPAVQIPERAALRAPRIQSEQRTQTADDAAAAAQLRHGSFWWLVAVVVVAGVILAIVL